MNEQSKKKRRPSLRLLNLWSALRGKSRLRHHIPLTSSTRETCLRSVAGTRRQVAMCLVWRWHNACPEQHRPLREHDQVGHQRIPALRVPMPTYLKIKNRRSFSAQIEHPKDQLSRTQKTEQRVAVAQVKDKENERNKKKYSKT